MDFSNVDWGSVRRYSVMLATPVLGWVAVKYGLDNEKLQQAFLQLLEIMGGVFILGSNVKAIFTSKHAADVKVAEHQVAISANEATAALAQVGQATPAPVQP